MFLGVGHWWVTAWATDIKPLTSGQNGTIGDFVMTYLNNSKGRRRKKEDLCNTKQVVQEGSHERKVRRRKASIQGPLAPKADALIATPPSLPSKPSFKALQTNK